MQQSLHHEEDLMCCAITCILMKQGGWSLWFLLPYNPIDVVASNSEQLFVKNSDIHII